MKKLFAIPVIGRQLCAHFGHCEEFALIKTEDQQITDIEYIAPPVHQPGAYPEFLASKGIHTIISGGMGIKAQEIFARHNIEVFLGIYTDNPVKLVEQYLHKQLKSGNNLCDH